MRSFCLVLAILFGAASIPAYSQSQDGQVLLAKKKKKRKKRKRTDDGETFGAEVGTLDGSGTGVGVHREQEGVDAPYWTEFSGLFSYSSLTNETGDAKSDQSGIGIGGELLFVLGSLAVGPSISYGVSEYETSVVIGEEVSSSKTKSTTMGIGAAGKFYLGNIDQDMNVPFGYASIVMTQSESKTGDSDAAKSSGKHINLGGGMHMFLDSNIALSPLIVYTIRDSTPDSEGAETTNTSGIELQVGIATFM